MTIANFSAIRAQRNAQEIRNKKLDNDIFFPVQKILLNDLTPDVTDTRHSAIVRTDTNEVIGVHSKRYQLTPNEIVFNALDKAMQRSQRLDLNGMTIDDKCAGAGAKTVRTYTLPEHNVEPTRNDVTQLRFTVTNSYDGSTNLNIKVGGYRLECLNGQTSGTAFAEYKNRHTSLFDAERMETYLNMAVENFMVMGEQWKSMARTPVSRQQVAAFLKDFTGGSRLAETLMGYYIHEASKLGENQWALYNALTFWSTHEQVKKSSLDNRPIIVVKREQEVGKALSHKLFKEAA